MASRPVRLSLSLGHVDLRWHDSIAHCHQDFSGQLEDPFEQLRYAAALAKQRLGTARAMASNLRDAAVQTDSNFENFARAAEAAAEALKAHPNAQKLDAFSQSVSQSIRHAGGGAWRRARRSLDDVATLVVDGNGWLRGSGWLDSGWLDASCLRGGCLDGYIPAPPLGRPSEAPLVPGGCHNDFHSSNEPSDSESPWMVGAAEGEGMSIQGTIPPAPLNASMGGDIVEAADTPEHRRCARAKPAQPLEPLTPKPFLSRGGSVYSNVASDCDDILDESEGEVII